MPITIVLSEEDYNMLIQMLIAANPLIGKIAKQAQEQLPPQPQPNQPNGVTQPVERR